MEKSFGTYLRHLRLKHVERLSIREVARRAEIDVSYLSRMEKDEVPPPREEIVMRLARVLSVEDVDELLWLANKIPPEFREVIRGDKCSDIPSFLRIVTDLTAEERIRLDRYVKRMLLSRKDAKS